MYNTFLKLINLKIELSLHYEKKITFFSDFQMKKKS